jgi:putative Mg2+ transporter-C (MgtC) family protein
VWWEQILATLHEEFSDLADTSDVTRVIVRLLVALALGAVLGYERESIGAAAGLRTHMLVAMGSALFVLVPMQAGMPLPDISRVMQGIVTGVGFLGAGAILKLRSGEISGLTTAAGIWLTAAVGVAAGLGLMATAVLSALLAWVVLSLLRRIKDRIDAPGGTAVDGQLPDNPRAEPRSRSASARPMVDKPVVDNDVVQVQETGGPEVGAR